MCYSDLAAKALSRIALSTFGVNALTSGTTKKGTIIAIEAAKAEFAAPIVIVRIIAVPAPV